MNGSTVLKVSTVILGLTVVAFFAQKTLTEEFPGNYPKFAEPVKAGFQFTEHQVRIRVSEELNDVRVFVFAYDSRGHMLAVFKPVENGAVEVNQGDWSDLDVRFDKDDRVAGFEMLKRMDSYIRKVDMFASLKEAKANGRPTGIQRCLYPVCTRCIEGCRSVISGGDLPLEMRRGEDGAIRPLYSKGKCPRCGKCFVWCPAEVITKSDSLSGQ
jgi:ferredoxin